MSGIKDLNYYQIDGWMLNKLNLQGVALNVYAIIYGFSQDGESEFAGSRQYLCDFIGVSKPTIDRALKELVEKGFVKKTTTIKNNITFNSYKADLELEAIKDFTGGNRTLPGGNRTLPNNQSDISSSLSDTRYNNLIETEISKEKIINRENRGICETQTPNTLNSNSIFKKSSSSTRTEELKELMSDKISSSRQTPSERAMGKTAKMLEHLQAYILKLDESQKVKECYCQWLKILAENKKLITKDQLVLAIEYLNRETDDEEVKIETIKLASMKAYRDFEYVVDKAIKNIKGDPNDFLHLGGKNKEYTKISDIAARQAEEFKKEMEAHPEKYIVPDFF